jgi:putative endonuclease
MALHNQFGKDGEDMACRYLVSKGFEILHRNWKCSYCEIDVIALKHKLLHIVEVKSRNYIPGFFPEQSVTKVKFRNMKSAANSFLKQHPEYKHVQFSVLSITVYKNKDPEYLLIEDVWL